MVNRLRWKLTAFNTVITGAILVGMTLLCLFISERNTRAQTFQNFSGNLSTVSSYLGEQNKLSATWLRQMESSGRFTISIQDGGTPLFSMGLSAERNNLAPEFQQARDRAGSEFDLSAVSALNGGSCAFSLQGEDGAGYFAGVSLIPKNGSMLELMLLHPLNEMENGIHRQRMVVCIAALVAVALLGAFSWCFTGKMLRPIRENQQRQAQFIAAASHVRGLCLGAGRVRIPCPTDIIFGYDSPGGETDVPAAWRYADPCQRRQPKLGGKNRRCEAGYAPAYCL